MNEDWRGRLRKAIDSSGRSMREVSLAAGRAHGYVNSILNEGKDPTVTHLEAVCSVLGISMVYLLADIPLTREGQELVSMVSKASESKQDGVRALLAPDKEP